MGGGGVCSAMFVFFFSDILGAFLVFRKALKS